MQDFTPTETRPTVHSTSANELHQIETRSSRTTSRDSSNQTQSPHFHEHLNDEPSNRQTETSTPESSSFWLAEYSSDDETEKLGADHPFMRSKTAAVVGVVERFKLWMEHPVEQDLLSCHDVGQPNPSESQDKGKGKGSSKRKRACTNQLETSQGNTDSSEPSSSQSTSSSKRSRILDQKLTFACPYAKKDPMVYKDCYRYTLSRIRDVKQHLARCHRNPIYCSRCMGTFRTELERDGHNREASCPLRPIRFDGITESQRQQLSKKSASNTSEEAQWFAIFDILFPGYNPRPESPYVNRELLQDITLYQDFSTSYGPRILSQILTQGGAVTWNLPNEERDLAAFQQTVLEEGLHEIFNQWVARSSSGSREDPHASLISRNSSNLTPPSSDTSVARAGSNPHQAPGVPGQEPTNTLAGSEAVQDASTGQDLFTESLNGFLNFEQEGLNFHQEIPYEGPDEELMRLMLGTQASSSFQPAPG